MYISDDNYFIQVYNLIYVKSSRNNFENVYNINIITYTYNL